MILASAASRTILRGHAYCKKWEFVLSAFAMARRTLPAESSCVDTIGELAALYALADVAFVGGSLVPRGGHNIIEPAQHGVAIVVGKHTENFRDIVEHFSRRTLCGSDRTLGELSAGLDGPLLVDSL